MYHRDSRSESSPQITGYASIWYTGDSDSEFELWSYSGERCVERIAPGCFREAIGPDGDDICGLWNHNSNCGVLGRTTAGTLRLFEDKKGLRYEIDAPDSELASALCDSISRGDVVGSSFSFSPVKESWSEEKQADGSLLVVRVLEACRLGDVGPVCNAAYQGTTVSVSRSSPHRSSYRPASPAVTATMKMVNARIAEIESKEREEQMAKIDAEMKAEGRLWRRMFEHADASREVRAIVGDSLLLVARSKRQLACRRARLRTISDRYRRDAEERTINTSFAQQQRNERVLERARRRQAARAGR